MSLLWLSLVNAFLLVDVWLLVAQARLLILKFWLPLLFIAFLNNCPYIEFVRNNLFSEIPTFAMSLICDLNDKTGVLCFSDEWGDNALIVLLPANSVLIGCRVFTSRMSSMTVVAMRKLLNSTTIAIVFNCHP